MMRALKKILGIQTTDQPTKPTAAFLFSGSAYFSNRVPNAFMEKWIAHGGEISSGTTLDVRARYFFATDPSDPWVIKLFAKSVMVIHAGWIVHCIDEAFQVPIAEYILDDRFVPGPPYKLQAITSGIYAPLSEPGDSLDIEPCEDGPMAVQISNTPSTPPSMPRKRKREQAYFDSPSGFLVLSGFDKDGMPRRPRKQRKLRFDLSFSPEGGRPGWEAARATGSDWLRDQPAASWGSDEFSEELGQQRGAGALRGLSHVAMPRATDTPDKSLTREGLTVLHAVYDHLPKPNVASSTISLDIQEKIKVASPVRTIDFTNLPPPSRRWRFPEADTTKPGGTSAILSITKPTAHKVKTPKKISFADHARVRVYTLSPQQLDAKISTDTGPAQCLGEDSEDKLEINVKTRISSDDIKGYADSTAEAMQCLDPQPCFPKIDDEPAQRLGVDQFEGETLTLMMGDVEEMRCRLLESAATNGVDDSQIATLFELGKTFRGLEFRHVW